MSKVYQMGDVAVHALREVDVDLEAGRLLVLLGASGSGKSTLLNILGGLDVASSGHVQYGTLDLSALDEDALTEYRRRHVGFVFQFYNLIPSLTARENVALVTDIAADPMPPDDALALVGLSERLEHFPAQLSGGEQQRVNVIADLEDPPAALGAGYRVEASIVVWRGDDVLTVPTSAIFRRGGRWQTFVAAHGRAQLQDVDLGHRGAERAEVLVGLEDGDRVVVFPSDRVADGVRLVATPSLDVPDAAVSRGSPGR